MILVIECISIFDIFILDHVIWPDKYARSLDDVMLINVKFCFLLVLIFNSYFKGLRTSFCLSSWVVNFFSLFYAASFFFFLNSGLLKFASNFILPFPFANR